MPRFTARRLNSSDREIRDGIPVTTLGRTLVDVSASGDPTVVRQADEALSQGRLAPIMVDVLSGE